MREVLDKLRRDAARYATLGGWYKNAGFWIGATYRARVWANGLPNDLLRVPLLIPFRTLDEIWRVVFNVHISEGARIEGGLCLIHARNLMLAGCDIGENCLIFHEVTIGTNAGTAEAPKIGNNVDIDVGARVLGKVEIGDSVKIGANCVVTSNVTDGTVVVTAAPRIVPRAIVDAFGPRRPAAEPPRVVNGRNGTAPNS
jgi:serine O-acetyltransferase